MTTDLTLMPVPRIKTFEFLECVKKIEGMNEKNTPIYEEFVGDLIVTYSIDMGHSYISATPAFCESHNMELASIPAMSMQNALGLLSEIEVITDGDVFQLSVGNDMEACTMLFPELWNQVSKELGGDVLVIVPHRNKIFYTKSGSLTGKEKLSRVISSFNYKDNHALSKNFFLFSDSKWSVVN